MRFVTPEALLILLLVPVVLWFGRRRQRPAAIAHPAASDLAELPISWAGRLRRGLPLVRALVLSLCVIALARPQWGLEATRIYSEGIAIAMVVDISGSMAALDLKLDERQLNRLDIVKETFRAFVLGDGDTLEGRSEDMIGLITFARYGDSRSPLTMDHGALLAALEQVEIVSLPGDDGTAIGDAMVFGLETLRAASGASRVMILLTDGSNNAGDVDPLQAAQIARALGVKVYAIGAGSRGIAMMPMRNRDGSVGLRPGQVHIDEFTLERIAELTGGRYFRATDGAALQAIYSEIDRLEKSSNVIEYYQQHVDLFPLLLLFALALLVAEMTLVNTRLRTVP